MQPLAIVEPLAKRKDLSAHLVPHVIDLVMNQFILQRTEEALGHGVVVAVPFAAHTWHDAASRQLPLIGHATVLRPLIRMMNQAGQTGKTKGSGLFSDCSV